MVLNSLYSRYFLRTVFFFSGVWHIVTPLHNLIDGDIDYDRMRAEGGVLLCDVSPGDETERRKTDYEIGDVIEVLSFAGAEKARGVYSSAIAAVSERHGMNAWPESYGKIAYFERGEKHIRDRENGETSVCLSTMIKKGVDDETFIPLQEEVLAELGAARRAEIRR